MFESSVITVLSCTSSEKTRRKRVGGREGENSAQLFGLTGRRTGRSMRQRRQGGSGTARGIPAAAAAAHWPRTRATAQTDDDEVMQATDSTRLRCRSSGGGAKLVRAAVIAAVLVNVGAEAVQTAGLSCPAAATAADKRVAVTAGSGSGVDGDAREQVAEWNVWTTNRCEANYAAAIGGDGALSEAKTSVVCAYYDPASFSDAEQRLSVQQMCRSGTQQTRSTLAGAHACYDTGDCLVEFMNVTPAADESADSGGAWEFRLGDLTTERVVESASEPVRVGELVVSSQASTLYVSGCPRSCPLQMDYSNVPCYFICRTFDGRSSSSSQEKRPATPVRFATDLSSARSLRSLLFIGLDVSASALPSFPASLRELYVAVHSSFSPRLPGCRDPSLSNCVGRYQLSVC